MRSLVAVLLILFALANSAPDSCQTADGSKPRSRPISLKKDTVKVSGDPYLININNSNCCNGQIIRATEEDQTKTWELLIQVAGHLITLTTAVLIILFSNRNVRATIKDGQISFERQLSFHGKKEEARMNEKWINYLRDAASRLVEKAGLWLMLRSQHLDYDQVAKRQKIYNNELDIHNEVRQHAALSQIEVKVRQAMSEFISAKSKIELLFKLKSVSGDRILNFIEKIQSALEDEREIKEKINNNQSHDEILKSIIKKEDRLNELLSDFNLEIKLVLEEEWKRVTIKLDVG